ncbi:MAG: hypothetical protein WC516_07425 [Patescibacteria group bacterium]
MKKKIKILPTLVTTRGSNFREKIRELKKLGLEEIAFFPTAMPARERPEAYRLLAETKVKRIPFVHLRSDMTIAEIDFLKRKYKTKIFNFHSPRQHPEEEDMRPYHKEIYIENTVVKFTRQEMKHWAGLCLDFTHLENQRLIGGEFYKNFLWAIKNFPVGCGHISAILKKTRRDNSMRHFDWHKFSRLEDFDYLARYKKLFPPVVALELENNFLDQLKAREYISRKFI